jgi:taurine dioxygenase
MSAITPKGYDPQRYNCYSLIRVTPMSLTIGARVDCNDLASLSAAEMDEVRQAWLDHLVLVFRNRELSDDELLTVGKYFGPLEPSPPTAVEQASVRSNPYISIISNVKVDGKSIGSLGNDEAIWHSDMSNVPVPPAASILTSHEIPLSGGGETGFINMYQALDTLPAALRSQIEGRSIYHDGSRNSAGVLRRHATSTSHPIIRTHPETGRNALYLGRRRDAAIDGLPQADSDALLDTLWAHTAALPAWHHEWAVGDTLVWDNRCTIHHRNPFNATARRIMHRTQTGGSAPALTVRETARHPRAVAA